MPATKFFRSLALFSLIAFAAALFATPAAALPVPSKTLDSQTLAERDADLAALTEVIADEEVAAALAAHGLTRDEVHQRLAQLSPEELSALSGQVDQLQAAGLNVPRYVWILVAILIGVVIVSAL